MFSIFTLCWFVFLSLQLYSLSSLSVLLSLTLSVSDLLFLFLDYEPAAVSLVDL